MRSVSKTSRPWSLVPAFRTLVLPLLILAAGSAAAFQDLAPFLRGTVDSTRDAWHVEVRNSIAYLANDVNGLQIYNVSNPASPVWIGAYTNSDAAVDVALGNNGTANYAFVAIGESGVDVINIANPANPQFVTNISEDVIDLQANAVQVGPNGGNYLYIADDLFGVKAFRISNPAGTALGSLDPTNLASSTMTEGSALDLAIPPNNFGILFVADGDQGLTRLNITNQNNIFESGNGQLNPNSANPGTALGLSLNTITAFVACDDGGVQTFDISSMAFKKQIPITSSAHSTFTLNSRVFVAASDGGMQIIDISTATPTRVGSYYTGSSNATYYVNVVGTNLFLAAGGLIVLNTNLLSNPQTFSSFTTTDLFGDVSDVNAVAVYGTNALIADNNLGVLSVSVANPGSPRMLAVVEDPSLLPVPPQDVTVSGNYAYLAEGSSGMEILDLTSNFTSTFQLPTPGPIIGVTVNGYYAYMSCGSSGLALADVSDPYFPVSLGTYALAGGFASAVAYTNGYAFLANGSKGLTVVDVNDPNNPLGVGFLVTGGAANGIAISGNYAFIADGGIGLSVADISDPFHPKKVAGLDIGDTANGIAINGNYAYISDGLAGMLVIDISNPTNPKQVGSDTSFDGPNSLVVYSNRVYVAASVWGMPILDVYQPVKFAAPKVITNTVHVFVAGPTNGQPIRIQRNSSSITNAAGWTDWQTLTFANTNFIELVDPTSPIGKKTFYRGTAP